MAMIIAGGKTLPDPTGFSWGINDISASDAGRTEDDIMHKNRTSTKRKLHLEWANTDPATTSKILNAFQPEYIEVTYPDALSGGMEKRTFYRGDPSAPLRAWTTNYKRYQTVSFDLVEK